MKRMIWQNPVQRRRWFIDAVRFVLLLCLAAISAVLIRRRVFLGNRCVNVGICGACPVFSACELPPALKSKQFSSREEADHEQVL